MPPLKLKISSKERTLGLIAVVVLLLYGVVTWIVQPQWNRLTEINEQIELTRQKLDRLQQLAGRKPLIERAYNAYDALWSTEPIELVQRGFLDQLEELASARGLQMNLKPKPAQQDGKLSRLSVELDVDATQDALLDFLDRLLSQPALIQLDRLRIATTASPEYPLRASLLVSKIVIRK